MNRPLKYRKKAADLTPERVKVLHALTTYRDAHGYSPSIRELAEALSLRSPSTVWNHLESLERQGLVQKIPRTPRGWKPAA